MLPARDDRRDARCGRIASARGHGGARAGAAADAEPFPADAAGAEEGGDCNAEPVQRLVGELYTPEVGEEARVEAGARVERALRPGQIVTMEFLSDRLSFTLDESGRITAANCG